MPRPPRPHWFRMLFMLRGSVLPRIAFQLVLTFAMGCWAFYASRLSWPWNLSYTPAPFGFLGVSLAVFLGFRNSASYDRWWEARKLWGLVVIHARSVARQSVTLIDSPTRGRDIARLLIAFVHAMRHQLHDSDPRAALEPWLTADELRTVMVAPCRPQEIITLIARQLAEARRAREIDPVLLPAIDAQLAGLEFALASCQRIAGTPLPFIYSLIIHRTVHLYCVALPFGLAQTVGVLTPLVTTFVAYPFFALEALAQEIEEPFGCSGNALDLAGMAQGLEAELRPFL